MHKLYEHIGSRMQNDDWVCFLGINSQRKQALDIDDGCNYNRSNDCMKRMTKEGFGKEGLMRM